MKLTPKASERYRIQRYGGRETIDGVKLIELARHADDGGSMVELVRLHGGSAAEPQGFAVAQVNYSALQPGVVKAFHVHREQTDLWFVRPEDRVLVVLVDVREGSKTAELTERLVLGDGRARLLLIPPGVAHGCRNLGPLPASILYFSDRLFSAEPEHCDEGRLPWDFVGREVWDVAWE